MIRISRLIPLCLLASASVYAAPKIEVDKTTFDCGIVAEGKVDKLQAQFTVKNAGDAPLKIDNVRPGCGCTVVKFDSIIQPGKSGIIAATVNIAGYRPGEITKYVTVQSNASNDPSLRLSINAVINSVIDLSEQYVSLAPGKPHTIVLASAKKDLSVSEVYLKPQAGASSSTPTWQAATPIQIPFKFAATDSTRKDGLRVFHLDLSAPAVTERQAGTLVIKTNHPEKPEIQVNGAIEK
jgi:hypothetical protein